MPDTLESSPTEDSLRNAVFREEPRPSGISYSAPPTVKNAGSALHLATLIATSVAQCGAYSTKCRGYKPDLDFAEASATIATASATAAYAVADAAPHLVVQLRSQADKAMVLAEMACASVVAGAGASGTAMPWSSVLMFAIVATTTTAVLSLSPALILASSVLSTVTNASTATATSWSPSLTIGVLFGIFASILAIFASASGTAASRSPVSILAVTAGVAAGILAELFHRFTSPSRSTPPLQDAVPHSRLTFLVGLLAEAAVVATLAAHAAAEAAAATDKTTTVKATGAQAPFDADDVERLYVASRVAQASASAARAAANAVSISHPRLSACATRAARAALTASTHATTVRLQLCGELSTLINPVPSLYDEESADAWLAKLAAFQSKTTQFELADCVLDSSCFPDVVEQDLRRITYMVRNGELAVTTARRAGASATLDGSSSATVGASTAGADDEDMDHSDG